MLLTITLTAGPASATATDLGFLLHKHPSRVQAFEIAAGTAHVFFPEATEQRCTAALLLEVDPIDLVRGRRGTAQEGFALGQYVNDRPYAASSLLSVAISRVFRTALTGRCDSRPEFAAAALPLQLSIPALPSRGGAELVHRLFEPLGWQVTAQALPLDDELPEWGDSRYVALTLTGSVRLADALNHLYVLLPVLDDAKHYWVSSDEIEKLIRSGAGWLAAHPERALITRRYLRHRGSLTRAALARLAESDDALPEQLDDAVPLVSDGDLPAARVSLADQRRATVLAVLRSVGARRVADLGCGEGELVAALLGDQHFSTVIGTDVSVRALERAAARVRLDRLPDPIRERLKLWQSSLVYRDARLSGLDAAVLMEVIEHVDPPRLVALAHNVFGAAAPGTVIVTTPNAEYNVRYESLAAGTFRHRDHRFEWTRVQFAEWADHVAAGYGYDVRLLGIGEPDPDLGSPTQAAVFTRRLDRPEGAARGSTHRVADGVAESIAVQEVSA